MISYPPWAMLARNFYDEDIMYPVLVQPKLNGVRAKWDHKEKLFISRQGKVFPRHVIPHIYEKYKDIQDSYDGELYCHGIRFQDICGRLSIGRLKAHEKVEEISFHAYDMISEWPQETRIPCDNHTTDTAYTRAEVDERFDYWLSLGYEGIMIRQFGAPYIVGRTTALLKRKPWKYDRVVVVDYVEGTGKFKGMLGAFVVKNIKGQTFKVGGGNITEEQRQIVWNMKGIRQLRHPINIKYTELSRAGIPLQPQIINFTL